MEEKRTTKFFVAIVALLFIAIAPLSVSAATVEEITTEAEAYDPNFLTFVTKFGNIAEALNYFEDRDTTLESEADALLQAKFPDGVDAWSNYDNSYSFTFFVAYNAGTTERLGMGERISVMESYFSAFNKTTLTSSEEWEDVLKIANGRWPGAVSVDAEGTAQATFQMVYRRNPDFSNANDDAAMKMMAYGLRPITRNLDSERQAIQTFIEVYDRNPSALSDWNTVRAIAYSGATR